MIVFGTRFFSWGSALTERIWRCSKCGHEGQFVQKSGMRFFTIYWIIPIFPVSGMKKMVQCPNCKTRYQDNSPAPGAAGGQAGSGAPIASPWND